MERKICIIGAFDFVNLPTGGQPVKTRELYYLLQKKYGKDSVFYIETYGWKRHPLKILFKIHKMMKKCNIFIILPAHNGVQIFSRILAHYKKKKDIKIIYDVIGGWLPNKIKKYPKLLRYLLQFDWIWVETVSIQEDLMNHGMNNVVIVPNFKKLEILSKSDIKFEYSYPYRVCTFSRVTEKKGIEDAITSVHDVNTKLNFQAYHLDIYGEIDESYEEKFNELLKKYCSSVSYKGIVPPRTSVTVIKSYYALLFPTKFYTEGVPGTLIDAYAAGVPVISSIWRNSRDVFKEGITGWGYEFGNKKEFVKVLERAVTSPSDFIKMKELCLDEAWRYNPSAIINQIDKYIG